MSGTGYGFAGMLTFLIVKTPDDISKSYKIFIIIMLSSGVFSAFDTSHNIAISAQLVGLARRIYMKYLNGLYISFVIFFFIQLASTRIFNDKYSGIALFISCWIFIFGLAFFTNAKRLKSSGNY